MKLLKMLLEETRINEMKMRLVEGTAENEASKKLDKIFGALGITNIKTSKGPVADKAFEEHKDLVKQSPKWLVERSLATGKPLTREEQRVVSTDPDCAIEYVGEHAEGDAFEFAPEAFSKDPYLALMYAETISYHFPEGEEAMAKVPNVALDYSELEQDRFYMAEPMFAKLKGTKDEGYLTGYLEINDIEFEDLDT